MGSANLDFFQAIILEEIALEGLDGTTLEILWQRLTNNLLWPMKNIDDAVKSFVWKQITQFVDVEFFINPHPKVCPIIFKNMDDFICTLTADGGEDPFCPLHPDIPEIGDAAHFLLSCPQLSGDQNVLLLQLADRGLMLPLNELCKESYSLVVVGDIVGSCPTYRERVKVSCQSFTFLEIEEKWENKLVIVASQKIRRYYLFDKCSDPEIQLSDLCYCILERIGRARRIGELSLTFETLKTPGTHISHFWTRMKNRGLITIQHVALSSSKTSVINLFHLRRFYELYRSSPVCLLTPIVRFLKTQPNCRCLLSEVSSLMPENYKKFRATVDFRRLFKIENVLHKTYYPDSSLTEGLTKKGLESCVRIISLINPDTDVNNIFGELTKEEVINSAFKRNSDIFNRPLVFKVYRKVIENGLEGLSLRDGILEFGLDKEVARAALAHLEECDLIVKVMHESGRQKFFRYYSKHHLSHVNDLQIEKNKYNAFNDERMMLENLSEDSDEDESFMFEQDEPQDEQSIDDMDLDETNSTVTKLVNNENSGARESNHSNSLKRKISNDAESPVHPSVPKKTKPIEARTNAKHSLQYIRRVNIVLEWLQKHLVSPNISTLGKAVKEEEHKLGLRVTPCLKSVWRIVRQLESKGKCKLLRKKVSVESLNKTKEITFVCVPTVKEDHPKIISTLQDVRDSLAICFRKVDSRHKKKKYPPELLRKKETKNMYGYCPKFSRMRILHGLIYYLLYDYEGAEDLNQEECETYVKQFFYESDTDERIPKCYVKNLCWKLFIPPLLRSEDRVNGWISIPELIMRIPIKLLFSLINLTHHIPGLETFLDHPVKRYYLLSQLPFEVEKYVTFDRKYISNVTSTLKNLCRIGLLQMGVASNKIPGTFYFNRRTHLLDTRPSPETKHCIDPQINYPVRVYEFNTRLDTDSYWNDAWLICLNTRINKRLERDDNIAVPNFNIDLIPVVVRQPLEAPMYDNGEVPGDHLGAAGYDSSLFAHLRLNWVWYIASLKKRPTVCRKPGMIKRRSVVQMKRLRINLNSKQKYRMKQKLHNTNEIKQRKKRIKWKNMEQDILIKCLLATNYLKFCSFRPPFHLFRKLLVSVSPSSNEISAQACQRRLLHLMKNPTIKRHFNLTLKDLQDDVALKNQFKEQIDEIAKALVKRTLKDKTLMYTFIENMFYAIHYNKTDDSSQNRRKRVNNFTLPATIEEFHKLYTYESFQPAPETFLQITDGHDASTSVVVELIISSLLVQLQNIGRPMIGQMNQIFGQFRANIVNDAVALCRSKKLVTFYKKQAKFQPYIPAGKGTYHLNMSFLLQMRSPYEDTLLGDLYYEHKKFFEKKLHTSEDNGERNNGLNMTLVTYFSNLNVTVDFPEYLMVLDIERIKFPDNDENIVQSTVKTESTSKSKTNSCKIKSMEDVFEMLSGDSGSESDNDLNDGINPYLELSRRYKWSIFKTRELFYTLADNRMDRFNVNPMTLHYSVNPGTPQIVRDEKRSQCLEMIKGRINYQKFKYEKQEIMNIIGKLKTPEERNLGLQVLDFIFMKNNLGATIGLLKKQFTNLRMLRTVITLLHENKLILRCGVDELRYVHIEYARTWLANPLKTTVNKDTNSERNFIVTDTWIQIRPWITLFGNLNEQILYGYCIRVAGYIASNPALPQRKLLDRFYPSIPTVDILEILEIFEFLDLIKRGIIKQSKTSLFSKEPTFRLIEGDDVMPEFEEHEHIFIVPNKDILMRIGLFIKQSIYRDVISMAQRSNYFVNSVNNLIQLSAS